MSGSASDDSAGADAREEWPLCSCFMVYARDIVKAIREHGLRTVEEVREATHAGCGCQTCLPEIEDLVALHAPSGAPAHGAGPGVRAPGVVEVRLNPDQAEADLDYEAKFKAFLANQLSQRDPDRPKS